MWRTQSDDSMMNVESKQCEFSVPRIRTKVLLYIRMAKVKNCLCAPHDCSLEEQPYSSIFLTSTLDRGECWTSRPGKSVPWKEQRYELNTRFLWSLTFVRIRTPELPARTYKGLKAIWAKEYLTDTVASPFRTWTDLRGQYGVDCPHIQFVDLSTNDFSFHFCEPKIIFFVFFTRPPLCVKHILCHFYSHPIVMTVVCHLWRRKA